MNNLESYFAEKNKEHNKLKEITNYKERNRVIED